MPFKKGQSGNPKGKVKGQVGKITQLKQDWMKAYVEGGSAKLWKRLIQTDVTTFLKLGVQMLPKELQADIQGKIEVSWIGEDNDPVQTP